MCNCFGLARSRARNDQHRAVPVQNRFFLLFVEPFQVIHGITISRFKRMPLLSPEWVLNTVDFYPTGGIMDNVLRRKADLNGLVEPFYPEMLEIILFLGLFLKYHKILFLTQTSLERKG